MANPHVSWPLDSPAARNNDVSGRYVGEDARSDDYINLIKARLEICQAHSKCCLTMSGRRHIDARQAPLPTRCIEVSEGQLRLRETGIEMGSYIALSHRWTPDAELYCTTTKNIHARRGGDATWGQRLPKTFRDTIDLAWRLGVRYIWIDSLCIIQHGDNGDDWRKEAIKMADYYQQALLTVVATSASNDHGLFPPVATPPPTTIARLPYRDKNGSCRDFFYVYSYNYSVDQHYQLFVEESDLLTRGWVFQEWLLSRRILYFTPRGLFFECQTDRPYNERGESSQIWSKDDLPTHGQQQVKVAFLFQTGSISKVWDMIIKAYSALSLTKPEEDRIIALAGIAKEFREAMTTGLLGKGLNTPYALAYSSGLWLQDIHHGLLWERKTSECMPRRLPGFPTWSWASFVCPVVWDSNVALPESDIKLAARMIAATTSEDIISIQSSQQNNSSISPNLKAFDVDNRFACLCFKGKAQKVTVRERFNQEEDLKIACKMSAHNTESAKDLWRKVCSYQRPVEICGWASFDYPDFLDDEISGAGLEIYAFHISSYRMFPASSFSYVRPWYYVFNVLYIRNINDQKYERVGVGRLFGKDVEEGFRSATEQYIEII